MFRPGNNFRCIKFLKEAFNWFPKQARGLLHETAKCLSCCIEYIGELEGGGELRCILSATVCLDDVTLCLAICIFNFRTACGTRQKYANTVSGLAFNFEEFIRFDRLHFRKASERIPALQNISSYNSRLLHFSFIVCLLLPL